MAFGKRISSVLMPALPFTSYVTSFVSTSVNHEQWDLPSSNVSGGLNKRSHAPYPCPTFCLSRPLFFHLTLWDGDILRVLF